MSLSARVVQELERLFDQQMWAFGRDVVRPSGNLLALRGCTRTPSTSPGATSSVWRLSDGPLDLELSSRGVAAVVADRACFVDREPMPRVLREADPVPLARLFAWLSDYEAWVAAEAPGWRAESLSQRLRPPAFPAEAMALRWATFAEALRKASTLAERPHPPTWGARPAPGSRAAAPASAHSPAPASSLTAVPSTCVRTGSGFTSTGSTSA